MIAIVNIGPIRGADCFGLHRYEVRINRQPICRFEHRRSDGLAKCLALAAKSVSKKDEKAMAKLIESIT